MIVKLYINWACNDSRLGLNNNIFSLSISLSLSLSQTLFWYTELSSDPDFIHVFRFRNEFSSFLPAAALFTGGSFVVSITEDNLAFNLSKVNKKELYSLESTSWANHQMSQTLSISRKSSDSAKISYDCRSWQRSCLCWVSSMGRTRSVPPCVASINDFWWNAFKSCWMQICVVDLGQNPLTSTLSPAPKLTKSVMSFVIFLLKIALFLNIFFRSKHWLIYSLPLESP